MPQIETELNEWEYKQNQKAKEIVSHLSQFVNSVSTRPGYFVKHMLREHRTLQQSMFNIFMACINAWADLPEGRYDLRNEFTVKQCRKIVEALGDDNYRAPLI
jgi:hypothetical protein